MAIHSISALLDVAVRRLPKRRDAAEVVAKGTGRAVDVLSSAAEGVAPGISRCATGIADRARRRGLRRPDGCWRRRGWRCRFNGGLWRWGRLRCWANRLGIGTERRAAADSTGPRRKGRRVRG